jgi:hypothetical protein
MDPVSWFAMFVISVAVSYVSYLIMPKPPQQEPPETKDLDAPEADPSMPIPVVFGTMRVKGLNTLGYSDLSKREFEVEQ